MWNFGKKFDSNIRRDAVVQEELRVRGIKCLVVWECTVKQMEKAKEVCDMYLNLVEQFLVSPELYKSF